ncbi:MAG TPA: hypothetical protein VKA63_01300, partial [Candidatus Krumholzibacteria bacterium]|nr:hypothetical protein [Candidatus Krumholzibacteria bacterium]
MSERVQPQATGASARSFAGPHLEQFGRGFRPSEGILCAYLGLTVLLLPFLHAGVAHWLRLFLLNLALALG